MKREIKFKLYRKHDENKSIDVSIHPMRIIDFKNLDFVRARFEEYSIIGLCQFTGLKCRDKKKNLNDEVYELDIFRHSDADDKDVYSVVMWIPQRAAFYMVPIEHYPVMRDNDVSNEKEFSWLFDDAALYDFSLDVIGVKVGNVFENPELLN